MRHSNRIRRRLATVLHWITTSIWIGMAIAYGSI